MKKSLPLIAILYTFSRFFNASPANAQVSSPAPSAIPEVSMVVSPPRYDITLNPGETTQKTVKITNNSPTKELILKAFVIDFIVQDDQGTPVKVTEKASGRFLASPWFTLERNEIVIKPGQQETLSVIVAAPQNALAGGHYAGVFFEPVESRGQKATVSYTAAQVGALFAVTINGDIKYDALIKDFKTKLNFYEYGPVEFEATIENQSDTHIRPQTSISIYDMLGRKMTDLPLEEVNIFPFTSRTLSSNWDQIWGLGRYRATFSMVYASGLTAERTLFFWIMPWKIIAAIAILFAVLIVLYISVKRHLLHRSDNRDLQIDELKRRIVELENNKR